MTFTRYPCEVCFSRAEFRIERRGDGELGWACAEHLGMVIVAMQQTDRWTQCIVTVAPQPLNP